MGNWTDIATVRRISGVTTTDFTDIQLQDFISLAQKEVTSKLTTKVFREPVLFIDSYRSNKVDGTNTTYFMRNWRTPQVNVFTTPNAYYPGAIVGTPNWVGNWAEYRSPLTELTKVNYLADFNYDNNVDINDIVVTQYNPNNQTETVLTISSIDISNCSFTLSTAPSNVQLYVTYAYTPLDPVNPDPFISNCVAYLASSYLFVGTDGFEYKFGNVSIKPGNSGGKGKQLHDKYEELLNQLIVNSNGGTLVSDMSIRI